MSTRNPRRPHRSSHLISSHHQTHPPLPPKSASEPKPPLTIALPPLPLPNPHPHIPARRMDTTHHPIAAYLGKHPLALDLTSLPIISLSPSLSVSLCLCLYRSLCLCLSIFSPPLFVSRAASRAVGAYGRHLKPHHHHRDRACDFGRGEEAARTERLAAAPGSVGAWVGLLGGGCGVGFGLGFWIGCGWGRGCGCGCGCGG